jgi:hypothetical protein
VKRRSYPTLKSGSDRFLRHYRLEFRSSHRVSRAGPLTAAATICPVAARRSATGDAVPIYCGCSGARLKARDADDGGRGRAVLDLAGCRRACPFRGPRKLGLHPFRVIAPDRSGRHALPGNATHGASGVSAVQVLGSADWRHPRAPLQARVRQLVSAPDGSAGGATWGIRRDECRDDR